MTRPIRRGDAIRIRQEWRDPGDENFDWIALEDEDGGRVLIAPVVDMYPPPCQVVTTAMVERIERIGRTD